MNERPTLCEGARAKPQRGSGAPLRSRSHYEAILELLRERGPQGVLGSELYARPELYGRSPRNRISEARAAGHLIEGRPHGSADWRYELIRDAAGGKPLADYPAPPKPSSYMERVRKEFGEAMPLFGGQQ